MARNVAPLVDPPKSERYAMRALTPEEANAFLAVVCDDRLEAQRMSDRAAITAVTVAKVLGSNGRGIH